MTTPSPAQTPRLAPSVAAAARYAADKLGRPVSPRTMQRWINQGRVPVFTVSPGRIQASLDGIDALADPVAGYRRRRRTGQDREFARRVANALIPLTDGQRDKLLALLLNMDGEHDAA